MATNKISLISMLFVVWTVFLTIEVITEHDIIDFSYLIFVIISYTKLINIRENVKE